MASTSLDQGEEISESMQQPMVRGDQRLVMYGGLTKKAKRERGCTAKERISKMPPCTAGKRSSIYRGVTRHRWTGRYEAHLWDKSTWNQNQNKKGKQVYLGAYDDEEAAARAYDLAALKYWGPGTLINFPVTDYTRDLEEMQNVSREEYLASLRRKSSGFARGMSKYRPISRWESQFGHSTGTLNGDETSSGNEYAGHFSTERKIDLSNYLKWWGHHKSNQSDLRARLNEAKLFSSDDVAAELRALESSIKPTEPYEMPRLGTSVKQGKEKRTSAMSILQKSSAYKSLQERTAKKKDKEEDSNDDVNKDKVDRLGMPLPIDDKSCETDRLHRPAEAAFGMSEGLSIIQANVFPMVPLLSSPLHASYSGIDPLSEPPLLWNPLDHVYPGGSSSRSNEVMKVESSSDYAFFQPGDEH